MNNKIILFVILILLIFGITTVSATIDSNTTISTIQPEIQINHHSNNILSNESNVVSNKNYDITNNHMKQSTNKKIIEKSNSDRKTANIIKTTTINTVNNYNDLLVEINNAKNSNSEEDYVINIGENLYMNYTNNNITWGESNTGSTHTIVINGQGHSINGTNSIEDKSYKFITINDNYTLKLINITITGCNNTNGGAIYNQGNITITNSLLKYNNATAGGAIYNNGTIIINNTTLEYNNATAGGAIYNEKNINITLTKLQNNMAYYGAGLYNENGNISLNNNIIQSNLAYGTNCIAGVIYNKYGNMVLVNNNIQNNTASYAGVIYNEGNIIITDYNIIQNNTASKAGGAIYNNGNLNITNNNIIANNSAEEEAGAIDNFGNMIITNSTFYNNYNKGTRTPGGAIITSGNITVNGSYFYNNNATYGGAIFLDTSNSIINNTIFKSNTGINGGGAIYTRLTKGQIINSSFINNTVTDPYNEDGGGAIVVSFSSRINITNCTFNNNSVNNKTGTTRIGGGAIYTYSTTQTIIKNSSFINNTVTNGDGGAIYEYSLENKVGTTIYSAIFQYNQAKNGGAIYITNSKLNITKSILFNNNATNGGAIYNSNSGILTSEYNILINNTDKNQVGLYNNNGNILSLNYNWWGQNNKNYQINPYSLGLTNYNGGNFTKWLYLNMTSPSETWIVNSPIIIITDLTRYYTLNGATNNIDNSLLPQYIPITFKTTLNAITNIIEDNVLTNGKLTVIFTPNFSGTHIITANIYTYNTSITNTINKINTIITVNNINGTVKKSIIITAIVTSNNNLVTSGTVRFIDTNGLEQTININNGIAKINTTYNKSGIYKITTTYSGNEIYSGSQTNSIAKIITCDVNINLTVKTSTTTGNTIFNITLKDSEGNNVTDGTIYFYNNGTLIDNTKVSNGTTVFNKIFNKAGNYNITVIYNSTLYNSAITTTNFTIKKSNTNLVVNPIMGKIQNIIMLQANITDQYGNNVTEGKVVFKINGNTIKNTEGNVIYSTVTNGIAQLEYIIPYNLAKENLTIQAIYSGTTDTYSPSMNNNTINVTKRTANINLIITKNPVKAEDTVTFITLVHDSNGTILNNGVVIFKFNGKTIKDVDGNTIKINVTNGQALLNYILPNGISARDYNITTVYSNNDYKRTETISQLTTEKIRSTITVNSTTINRGSNNTLLTGIIKDINGNLIVGTHKIAVKLNGKSIGIYTTTNGIINTNITLPNTLKNINYNITVKIGDSNGYYGTDTTTKLIINNP